MTKLELMKLVLTEEELTYCDTAIPQGLWSQCNTSICVYDCRNNKLVNLAEELVTRGKLDVLITKKDHAEYTVKRYRKKYGKDDKLPVFLD